MSVSRSGIILAAAVLALLGQATGVVWAADDSPSATDRQSGHPRIDPSLSAAVMRPAAAGPIQIRIEGQGDAEALRDTLVDEGVLPASAEALPGTSIVASTATRSSLRQLVARNDIASISRDVTMSTIPIDAASHAQSRANTGGFDRSVNGAQSPSRGGDSQAAAVPASMSTPSADPRGGFSSSARLDEIDPDLTALRQEWGISGDGDGSPYTYSERDQVIVVIDSGIDDRHPQLDGGKVLLHEDFSSRTEACPDSPNVTGVWDELGHGTFVASVAAGRDGDNLGVAPGAALIDLKVFGCVDGTDSSRVDAALGWVVENGERYGVDVVNLSLGSAGSTNGTDPTARLVNQLVARGINVSVAAGNGGPLDGRLGSPASAEHALTVGAQGAGPQGEFLADFSSRGPTLDGRDGIDLLAPGVNIQGAALSGGLGIWTPASGTSFSAPYVAGLLALLRSAEPAQRPSGEICPSTDSSPACWDGILEAVDPLADVLVRTAADFLEPGPDAASGHGMVRATRALAQLTGRPFVDRYPDLSYLPETEVPFGGALALLVDSRAGVVGVTLETDPSFEWTFDERAWQYITDFTAVHPDGSAAEAHWPGYYAGALLLHTQSKTPVMYVPRSDTPTWVLIEGPPNFGDASRISASISGQLLGHVVVPGFAHTSDSVAEGDPPSPIRIDMPLGEELAGRYFVRADEQTVVPTGAVVDLEGKGEHFSITVGAVDDERSEGRHTGQITLMPENASAAPPIVISVPIIDNETKEPESRRLLLAGEELPRRTRIGESLLGGDGTVAASLSVGRTPEDARRAIYVARRGEDFRALDMSEMGRPMTECWHDPASLEGSGRYLLSVVPPLCAGDASSEAAPLRPAVMWTDLDTGELRYVGPDRESLMGYEWRELADLYGSRLSSDGQSVAYIYPGARGYGVYVRDLRTGSESKYLSLGDFALREGVGYVPHRILALTDERLVVEASDGNSTRILDVAATPSHEVMEVSPQGAGSFTSADRFALLTSSHNGRIFAFSNMANGDALVYDAQAGTVENLTRNLGSFIFPSWVSDDGNEVGPTVDFVSGAGYRSYAPAAFDVRTGDATSYASPATADQRTLISANGGYALSIGQGLFAYLAGTSSLPMATGDTNGAPDFVLGMRRGVAPALEAPIVKTSKTDEGLKVSWSPVKGAARYEITSTSAAGVYDWFDLGTQTSWIYSGEELRRTRIIQVRSIGVTASEPVAVRIPKPPLIGDLIDVRSSGGQLRARWQARVESDLDTRRRSELQWQISVDGEGWRNVDVREQIERGTPTETTLDEIPVGSTVRMRASVVDAKTRQPWSAASDPVLVVGDGEALEMPREIALEDLVHVSPHDSDSQSATATKLIVPSPEQDQAPVIRVRKKRAFALRLDGLLPRKTAVAYVGNPGDGWVFAGQSTTSGSGQFRSRSIVVDKEMDLTLRVRVNYRDPLFVRLRVVP